jgi:phosphoserine phosphatase RsbU/P
MNDIDYLRKIEKELKDLKEQNSAQAGMFDMTTAYLKQIQDQLKISENNLRQSNKHLTDSINYAKYIQNAFIVQIDVLQKFFPNSFIVNKPKDIVGGDFIWAIEKDEFVYLAIGDCTGHGVPGAMLSIFMISLFNQLAANPILETPSQILRKLDKLIQTNLSLYQKQINDTAEIGLIRFNRKREKLLYAGVKRPLVHCRMAEVNVYKGAKTVLGSNDSSYEPVYDLEINITKGDMLYMFSDGYADQFGGERNSKFSTKKMISLLQENANEKVHKQKEIVEFTFTDWKGLNEQIDDVLLVGIQI